MKKKVISFILCFIMSISLIAFNKVGAKAEDSSIDYSEYYVKNYEEELEDEKYIVIDSDEEINNTNEYLDNYCKACGYYYNSYISQGILDYPYCVSFTTKSNINFDDIKNIFSKYDTKYLFGYTYSNNYLINRLQKYVLDIINQYKLNIKNLSVDSVEFYNQYINKFDNQFTGDEKEYFEFIKHLTLYGTFKYCTGNDVSKLKSNISRPNIYTLYGDDYLCLRKYHCCEDYWENQSEYHVRFANKEDCFAAIDQLKISEYLDCVNIYSPDIEIIKENSIVIKSPYNYTKMSNYINEIKEEVMSSLSEYDINYIEKQTDAFYLVLSDIKEDKFDEVFYIVKGLKDLKGTSSNNPYAELYITRRRAAIILDNDEDYWILPDVEQKSIPYTKFLKLGYNNLDKYVITTDPDIFLSSLNDDSIIYPPVELELKTIYRLYNRHTGEHLFTSKKSEYDKLEKKGWTKEGETFNGCNDKDAKGVYRVYNPNAKGGDHHYTMSQKEAENLVKKGWKWDNEGNPLFYAAGDKKVYRLYNKADGRHHYTPKVKEKEKLVGLGWVDEGVAWETLE